MGKLFLAAIGMVVLTALFLFGPETSHCERGSIEQMLTACEPQKQSLASRRSTPTWFARIIRACRA